MVTTSTTWTCRLGVGLLLIACMAGADELGASLQLEGRMACQRGVAWLIARQNVDGSWQQATAPTAHAALALAATAGDVPDACVARRRALAYVQERLARVALPPLPAGEGHEALPAGVLAVALRLFLREGIPVPPEFVVRLQGQVAAGETLAGDDMIVLETLLLRRHGAVAAPPGETAGEVTARLAEKLLAGIIVGGGGVEPAGERLAARMVMGDAAAGAAARERLTVVLSDAGEARLAELYWLARVLYAQDDAGAGAAWRTHLMTVLLEKQRGDGGWGRSEDSPAARIVDSAWALQTLAVLLAAAPQGE